MKRTRPAATGSIPGPPRSPGPAARVPTTAPAAALDPTPTLAPALLLVVTLLAGLVLVPHLPAQEALGSAPDMPRVEVPEALRGYRSAFETERAEVSRQRGIDTPAGGDSIAVSARDPVAARVGYLVLEAGGNAADAAFAVASVLSVREPWFSHVLGGGSWALHRDGGSGAVVAVNGSGTVGSNVDVAFFREGEDLPEFGMEWAVVPGAWAAWVRWLAEFGTMELDTLLAPAVDLAYNGISASRTMVGWIRLQEEEIRGMPDSAGVFLPEDRPPRVGERLYQRDLAQTFGTIIEAYREARPDGRAAAFRAAHDVYYRGPIARRIVEYAAANRGSLTKQDFEEYRAYVVEPLETRYRNWTVYNTGLHSQGMVMTLALNLLRGFPLSDRSWDDPETIHLIAEATKLAHIDKYHYVGDPAFVDVPLERLLSHDYADRRRRRIDPEDAIEWPEPGGLDGSGFTSTFSLVDANGNGAAVTASVGAQFVVAGDTGIVMNQRVKNMQLEPGNPNVLAPGKRVRHTVNPYIAVSDDGQVLFGGNTGYDTQSQGQIQQFLHVAEFGANVQQAVSRPRYIVHAFPDVTYPHEVRNVLALESYYDDDTVQALRERGHRISRRAIFGNAAAVLLDTRSGRRTAGADPRGENLALAR